jgi:hypothetical protein
MFYQSFRGFKIARSCSPLNHLLFADDLVIFTTAISSEATLLLRIVLINIALGSGQTVNASKSNILFSKNTTNSNISAIRHILPYQITPANAKHIGLPILYEKSKTTVFSNILDKVNGKIEG